MSEQIRAIPPGVEHSWQMETAPGFFRAHSPKFGTLTFGLRPEGPNAVGWGWKEIGGGGVNIVPHVIIFGKLLVGMIYEKRPMLQGGYGWNIPRGFLEPGSPPLESAKKEWSEEVGSSADQIKELIGPPQNPNSTFFDTSDGNGTHIFEFSVSPDDVILGKELDASIKDPCPDMPAYVFADDRFAPTAKMGEKILACRFFHWSIAAVSEDANTASGFARLLGTHPELVKYL